MLEHEVKVRVDGGEWDRLRSMLERECAKLDVEAQVDDYYSHPCRDFGDTDEALRIRAKGEACVLTYKGPRTVREGVKTRVEYKVRISKEECSEMRKVLEGLGFVKRATVSKVREKYLCEGRFKVALDRVEGLGLFVEVETVGDSADPLSIRGFLERMGVRGEIVEETYLEMLLSLEGRGARP